MNRIHEKKINLYIRSIKYVSFLKVVFIKNKFIQRNIVRIFLYVIYIKNRKREWREGEGEGNIKKRKRYEELIIKNKNKIIDTGYRVALPGITSLYKEVVALQELVETYSKQSKLKRALGGVSFHVYYHKI